MLAGASARMPAITWQQADIKIWRPQQPASLIYSNAALHWLDDHDRLFPALFGALAPGGVLAVQMPANFDQPSHRLLYELAGEPAWRDSLAPQIRAAPVAEPAHYWRLLQAEGAEINLWKTVYFQRLTGENAILRWMEGTTLRPFLAVLSSDQSERFRTDYAARLAAAYRLESDGSCLFPFYRLFMVARRTG
jgi:trans-aconitate 2-methyltransferase